MDWPEDSPDEMRRCSVDYGRMRILDAIGWPKWNTTEFTIQLQKLPQRSQEVLAAVYGLDGEGLKSLEEVARKRGVTRERVRQIAATALINLKPMPEDQS